VASEHRTSSSGTSSVVGERYAKALMTLAVEQKKSDAVAQDLQDLEAMLLASSDLVLLIRTPRMNPVTVQKAIGALAEKAKFQDVTRNFLNVLIVNGRLNALESIIKSFQMDRAKQRGEVTVDVQLAQDLSEKQKKELQAALSKAMGSDVSVRLRIVPDILGGMIVQVGSRMVDDSVRRKLEKLKLSLGVTQKTSINENNISNKNEVA